jgi:serine/threonine-protein kinase
MAPERFKSGPASAASDVYAATATFFECVTGARPYPGSTTLELMVQHTEAPIPDELAPEPLRPLIRAGLAKAPEDRPSSAMEFVAQLDEIARKTYGEDWEERGQRKLATILAALPLLLLRGQTAPTPEAATDFAVTNLGAAPAGRALMRRSRGPVAATVGVLVVGLVISLTVKPAASETAGLTVQVATTVTANEATPPGPTSTGSSAAAVAATKTSASPTPSGTSTTSATTAPGTTPTAPSQGGGGGGGTQPTQPTSGSGATTATTAQTTAPATQKSTTPPPPVLTVNSVAINAFGCQGRTGIYATVEVKSDGKASGTLTFTWFSSTSDSGAHTAYGSPTVVTLSAGQTDVTQTEEQDFSSTTNAYWGVEVTTSPSAASGNGTSDILFGTNCEIQ